MSMTSIVESIKGIVEAEIRKLHIAELGVVTEVFPHSSDDDKDNYECNVRLKNKDVVLQKVPVATQHIGLANIPHVGDLVLLTFINGNVNAPIIVGRLYNDQDRPPTTTMEEFVYEPPYTKNEDLRRIQVKLPDGVVTISIHDNHVRVRAGKSVLSMSGGGSIQISSGKEEEEEEEEEEIGIQSPNGPVNISGGSVNISGGPVDISGGKITVEGSDIELKAEGQLSLKGATVNIESQGAMTIKASSQNIESQGAMTINAAGKIAMNGTPVNMNNGALEVI